MSTILGFTRRHVLSLYSIPLVLLLWQLGATQLDAGRLMPDLGTIWRAFLADIQSGTLVFHAEITLLRAMSGYGLAVVIGVPLGVMMARSRLFETLFEPIFFIGYPIPKIALYPVFIFIFGIGTPSAIAFIFLECLYPIVIATYFAFKSLNMKFVWSARNMGASRARVFWAVMLPATAPGVMSGLRIALPVSIIVVIVVEMIGGSRGLGYYITIASASFEYQKIYAGILMVALIGFTLDRIMFVVRSRIVYWERADGAVVP